jgi:hypothetical protein
MSNYEQEEFQDQDSNEHLSTLLNMESINQRENFQSIERLYMKMKEENKREIMIINENFKRIEESCSNFSNKDINMIMTNYKNMINMNQSGRRQPDADANTATPSEASYQERWKKMDDSLVNYSQWFKLNFSNLLYWISARKPEALDEAELLEFIKDINDNMVDDFKADLMASQDKQDKESSRVPDLEDYSKDKSEYYNKSYNMDDR